MTSIKLIVTGASARAEVDGLLTSGMVGIPVTITYDSAWDGLTKAVVCRAGSIVKTILNVRGTATVAHECMVPNQTLFIGIEGRNADGTLVIPTIWARCGLICSGANAEADPSTDPTLPVWARIESKIGNLDDLNTQAKENLVAAINEAMAKGGGTVDEATVQRIVEDYLEQNPVEVPVKSVNGKTGTVELNAKDVGAISVETDPTVPAWAKEAEKPSYTAQEVGADPSGTAAAQVAAHNTGTDTHSDIRLLIQGLTDRLNALADSDDTTLDQLSEVVAYIKSNRSLIEAITTNKVSVADIVDNLTTNVSNKPLSAAQGVVIKTLIDAITIPTALPNPNALTFTGAVAGSYDGSEPLTVDVPSGGDNGGAWELVADVTMEKDVQQIDIALSKSCKRVWVAVTLYGSKQNSGKSDFYICVGDKDYKNMIGNTNRVSIDFRSDSMIWNFQSLYAEVSGGVIHEIRGYQTSNAFINGWATPGNYPSAGLMELFGSAPFEKIETVRLQMWGVYFGAGTRVVVRGT